MSRLKTFAAVVLAATVPAMAQAADFNLTGGSGTTSTATFSSGGIGLNVTAWTDDGEIMGVKHKTLAIEGVQFHPESILTEHGHAMLKNFLEQAA